MWLVFGSLHGCVVSTHLSCANHVGPCGGLYYIIRDPMHVIGRPWIGGYYLSTQGSDAETGAPCPCGLHYLSH